MIAAENEDDRRAREEAKADRVARRSSRALRPPPKLRLSEWADQHFVLSSESSAQAGPWRTLPYQVGLMDAITDPAVEFWTLMKSARIGATKIFNATIGYHIDQDPTTIMVVQPTVEDGQGYSKEEIAPMLSDVPALRGKVSEAKAKDGSNTILHKVFPGGSFNVVGANSPRGFRRVSRRVVLFDEVDGYPPSAGTEGDQVKLGIKRTETYWNRKICRASTPTLAGASRIEAAFLDGDQRRFFVPCPQCGHMDILVFRQPKGDAPQRGHWMAWPAGKPEEAHFVCSRNGCVIEHHQKRAMVGAGEWRAEAPFRGHASFHIWAAYSFSANATWAQIAKEFVAAEKSGDIEELKTFVNTTLGEVWQEKGDAPEWEPLHRRRELYEIGKVPPDVIVLTAGVDVQKDRLIYEVVGWAADKQNWSIETGVLPGDTASVDGAVWGDRHALLNRTWPGSDRAGWSIRMLAIDSGYNTNTVYTCGRR
jgi:phage terminase large subunit GpA-like protein